MDRSQTRDLGWCDLDAMTLARRVIEAREVIDATPTTCATSPLPALRR